MIKEASEKNYTWKNGKKYIGINEKFLLTNEEYARLTGRMIRFHKWSQS